MAPIEVTVKAILFDMDGTLVDSTAAVVQTMIEWCVAQGIDQEKLLAETHGTRTRDIIKRYQLNPPGSSLSEAELTLAAAELEDQMIVTGQKMAEAGKGGIIKLPGVQDLLAKLDAGGARWGIVTSGIKSYADSALAAADISPPFLITAEKYSAGKPDPEPYLTGLTALNARFPNSTPLVAADALVVEDAPAGIQSGSEAGCKTLAVCTGQTVEVMRQTAATFKVVDLARVQVIECDGESIRLSIRGLETEGMEQL